MKRYSSRAIDEASRIVIHSELRQRLNLSAGDKISLRRVDSIVILQKADGGDADSFSVQVNDLGTIDLPAELR